MKPWVIATIVSSAGVAALWVTHRIQKTRQEIEAHITEAMNIANDDCAREPDTADWLARQLDHDREWKVRRADDGDFAAWEDELFEEYRREGKAEL